jgi:hypothetical protein
MRRYESGNEYVRQRRTSKENVMTDMARRLRLLVVTAVVALTLSAFAGTAAAATGPSQGTGLVGACNMLAALNVGANGGLLGAFSVENVNGWDGKWVAVAASGCDLQKP